jgi:hypothetical protein
LRRACAFWDEVIADNPDIAHRSPTALVCLPPGDSLQISRRILRLAPPPLPYRFQDGKKIVRRHLQLAHDPLPFLFGLIWPLPRNRLQNFKPFPAILLCHNRQLQPSNNRHPDGREPAFSSAGKQAGGTLRYYRRILDEYQTASARFAL